MIWIRIWVHLVFTTQNRKPFLQSLTVREKFFEHIRQEALKSKIWIDTVNGYEEHMHCILSLGKSQNIHEVVQVLLNESAQWISSNEDLSEPFRWQQDYWAVSVSESKLEGLRNQIIYQEKHHEQVTFDEELELFLQEYDHAWIQNHGTDIQE